MLGVSRRHTYEKKRWKVCWRGGCARPRAREGGGQGPTRDREVVKDPSSEGTLADIRAQTAMMLELRNDFNEAAEAINQIEWIRRQVYDLKAVMVAVCPDASRRSRTSKVSAFSDPTRSADRSTRTRKREAMSTRSTETTPWSPSSIPRVTSSSGTR